MRFLLHNEEAVYDATTKVWHYTLDKRISNPTSLTVKKATFSPVSSLIVHPHVIYMHSTALSDMILDKHTVVLRANAHENSTDVIGVLEETHTRGRYALTEREGPFRLSPSSNKRVIDIYFTDGTGTHLDGELDPSAPPVIGAADDATMVALGSDLGCWLDMEYACLDVNSAHVDTVGDAVEYLRNRSPGTSNLFFTCSTGDFAISQFGQTLALAGGPNVSGAYAQSGTSPNFAVDAIASRLFMFKAPPTALGQGLVNLPANIFRIEWVANQLRALTVSPYAWTYIQNTNFLPNSNWYVECTLVSDPAGDGSFQWRFIDLDEPNLTEITENTDGPPDSAAESEAWNISAANDHFTCQISHLCVLNTGGPNKRNTIRDWMLGRYAVEGGALSPGPPEPATFFAQLNIRTR